MRSTLLAVILTWLVAAALTVAVPVEQADAEDAVDVLDLDEGVDPNYDQASLLFKRVLDGQIPRFMFPFIAVISVDLSLAAAQATFTSAYPNVSAFELSNLFNTYTESSHPYCAGAVLQEHWVLTSARCLNDIQKNGWLSSMTIYSNRKQLRPTVQEAWVQFRLMNGTNSVFYNTLYANTSDHNDLVLLNVQAYDRYGRLVKKLHSARYKFPRIANQADADSYINSTLTAGGWGLTDLELEQNNGYTNYSSYFFMVRYPPVFRAINTVPITAANCAARTGLEVNPNTLCTVPANGTNATLCSWDAGAPLFITGNWVSQRASYNSKLIAIFSRFYLGAYETVCGGDTTSVFTYLPSYCQWLASTTNEVINCATETAL